MKKVLAFRGSMAMSEDLEESSDPHSVLQFYIARPAGCMIA
jgi:hypothetical protein